MRRFYPPDIIFGDVPQYVEAPTQITGNVLEGLGVAPGRAEGIVRKINNPVEGGELEAHNVLVAPSTDPAWTPLFLRVSAIVMETGGYLSHGAIVAREYGVPAVVNIAGIMKTLEDDRKIIVDGNEGKVYLR